MERVHLADEIQTVAYATKFARCLQAPCVLFLHGDLGVGKTTFVRGILRGMGYRDTVKSPTYTLVEQYRVNDHPIVHFDLYRLIEAEELEYLGIRDYFSESSLVFVEWPDRGGSYLPDADVHITLDYSTNGRVLTLRPNTEIGENLVNCIANVDTIKG